MEKPPLEIPTLSLKQAEMPVSDWEEKTSFLPGLFAPIRKLWVILRILPPFFVAFLGPNGVWSRDGRTLIRGKARRIFLSFFPAWVDSLKQKHQMSGGCTSCGASCKLLFQCPHWNETTNLCTVYRDRPSVCKQFPVTPADIRDRNIVQKHDSCGYKHKGLPVQPT